MKNNEIHLLGFEVGNLMEMQAIAKAPISQVDYSEIGSRRLSFE